MWDVPKRECQREAQILLQGATSNDQETDRDKQTGSWNSHYWRGMQGQDQYTIARIIISYAFQKHNNIP